MEMQHRLLAFLLICTLVLNVCYCGPASPTPPDLSKFFGFHAKGQQKMTLKGMGSSDLVLEEHFEVTTDGSILALNEHHSHVIETGLVVNSKHIPAKIDEVKNIITGTTPIEYAHFKTTTVKGQATCKSTREVENFIFEVDGEPTFGGTDTKSKHSCDNWIYKLKDDVDAKFSVTNTICFRHNQHKKTLPVYQKLHAIAEKQEGGPSKDIELILEFNYNIFIWYTEEQLRHFESEFHKPADCPALPPSTTTTPTPTKRDITTKPTTTTTSINDILDTILFNNNLNKRATIIKTTYVNNILLNNGSNKQSTETNNSDSITVTVAQKQFIMSFVSKFSKAIN